MSFLQNMVSIETSAGTVIPYTGSTAPTGWLLCDGTGYLSTTYSALYNVIGTAYGTGNGGTTNFNVPNFQAAFLRGAGSQTYPTSGGTTYGGSAINTAQGTALQTHNHSVTNTSSHTHTVSGNHTHDINPANHNHSINQIWDFMYFASSGNDRRTGTDSKKTEHKAYAASGISSNKNVSNLTINANSANIAISSQTPTVTVDNNTPTVNESIPFNYAINWIIKY
jgi:microcystin-dependent protein